MIDDRIDITPPVDAIRWDATADSLCEVLNQNLPWTALALREFGEHLLGEVPFPKGWQSPQQLAQGKRR